MSTPPAVVETTTKIEGTVKELINDIKNYKFELDFERIMYTSTNRLAFLSVFQFAIFVFIVYKFNPFNLASKYPVVSLILTLVVGFIYTILFSFFKEIFAMNDGRLSLSPADAKIEIKFVWQMLKNVIFFIVLVGLTKSLIAQVASMDITRFVLMFINVFIVVGFMSLVYFGYKGLKKPSLEKKKSIFDLLYKIVLFLPCLLIMMAEYFQKQFKVTTNIVWTIIVMEIIFLILYFVVPVGLKKLFIESNNGTLLQKTPLPLNQMHTVGDFETMHGKDKHKNGMKDKDKYKYKYDDGSDKMLLETKRITVEKAPGTDSPFFSFDSIESTPDELMTKRNNHHFNYSISFWFNLHTQPLNTSASYARYTPILSYGKKPVIEFNATEQILRVQSETAAENDVNTLKTICEVKDVMYQKWNYMVINSDGGTMDIFLNGDLVGTKGNIAPYMSFNQITLGQDHGLNGSICNVIYYGDHLLTKTTIISTYKYLRGREIPVI
jgi:hypothetical protein